MRKIIVLGILATICCITVSGCAVMKQSKQVNKVTEAESETTVSTEMSSNSSVVYEDKNIKIMDYKDLHVNKEEVKSDEELIKEAINTAVDANADYTAVMDRPVNEDDTAIIDVEATINGDPCLLLCYTDYNALISVDTIAEGFNKNLVGKTPGESFLFDLTMPKDFMHQDIASKTVTFKVTIKSINGERVLPEYSDTLVKEHYGFETTAEYEQDYLARQKEMYAESARESINSQIRYELMERSEVKKVDNALIEKYKERLLNPYKQSADYEGVEFDVYITDYLNTDKETLENSITENAIENAKWEVIIRKVAELETIKITDEEFESCLVEKAKDYGFEDVELYKKNILQTEDALDQEYFSLLENKVCVAIAEDAQE